MSKRAPRTTKRERARERVRERGLAWIERSELTITRDSRGRRIVMIVDEASGFERAVHVDAHPELARLVGMHAREELAQRGSKPAGVVQARNVVATGAILEHERD